MKFEQVPGQEETKVYLRDAIARDRLPHALLFLGKTGYGSLAMAMALAQYLMCEQRTPTDACGQCGQCKKAEKLIHPDIHFTYPVIGGNRTSLDLLSEWRKFVLESPYRTAPDWFAYTEAENKQGNINKFECLRIIKTLGLKIFEGAYKIQIIWMPEYLGKEGNRLLKIIEEPPDNTVFILVAEQQEAILNTILSRCQVVSFRPLDDKIITGYITGVHSGVSSQVAGEIAFLASGDLTEALNLVRNPDQLVSGNWLEWLRITYKGSGIEMRQWVDGFAKMDREPQKTFVQFGLFFLREMLLAKVSPGYPLKLQEREKMALTKLVSLVQLSSIETMIGLIDELVFHLERNANVRISMLDISIQMHYLLRNKMASFQEVNALT